MTCVNEKIHVRRSEEVYRNTAAGFHTEKAWRNRKVTCDHGGLEMDLVLDDRESITHAAMQSPSGAWDCPVPECPGSVQTQWNLRRHFRDRHPLDLVKVPGKGVLLRCPRCDMQTNFANSPNHELSKLCREGAERKAQYAAPAQNARALEVEFTAYGETLERVEVFKYLGRLMAMDDNDMRMRSDIISKRLGGSGRGFRRVKDDWQGLTDPGESKERDGTCQWSYPSKDDVYEEVGLFPIHHYIEVRRQTVAAYIVNRPIFDRCVRGRGEAARLQLPPLL
ncbi:hypothetical protein THAOC_11647, partial [Thalassiosira oceanica]